MEKEKISEIVGNPSVKSNKDLNESLIYLNSEFEKTKEAIVRLTRYLDVIEESYNKVNEEIGNRVIK